MNLKNYAYTSADWRKIIRLNKQRSYFVIGSFILMYVTLGFVVDLYFSANKYPQLSLPDLFHALIHLQIFPIATLLLGIIASIAILVTFIWHNKIMLLGTEYFEITPQSARTPQEQQLYNVVEEMKISSGLAYMPKVFVIEADYMNAFASGYSEKSSMLAITRGLMEKLNRAELQAVMAHELSHIRHLDIKLTLMAAVLSNITLIVIDLLFRGTFYGRNTEDEKGGRNALFIIIMILRILLPISSILLIFYLSRSREYMADAGCVELTRDNTALASALIKIYNDHSENVAQYSAAYQNTPHESIRKEAYIFDPKQAGISSLQSLSDLFSTHPSIQKRLAALGFKSPHL